MARRYKNQCYELGQLNLKAFHKKKNNVDTLIAKTVYFYLQTFHILQLTATTIKLQVNYNS